MADEWTDEATNFTGASVRVPDGKRGTAAGGVVKKGGTSAEDQQNELAERTHTIATKLKAIYKKSIMPVEKRFRYDYFYDSPIMNDIEFDGTFFISSSSFFNLHLFFKPLKYIHTLVPNIYIYIAKPQVLLMGQYSTGKTSFIKYVLGREFPGSRIGPEPTTDKFTVLLNGPEERTIPGNALSVHPDLPFRGLERFGVSFLSRFEGSQLPSSVLKAITFVDTPGVLSGEKQRVNRGYDFTKVVGWFAERADLILILFDAHKLDISDELRAAIDAVKGHEDKVRCILNKADQIDRQQLVRVYGALLWSLGKVIQAPEVLRVYVGSFWEQPLQNMDNAELFEKEERDLMKDLAILPRQSAVRKINEMVKRVRKVKTLAYIIGYLKNQMPGWFGKDKKQQKLIDDLPTVFRTILKQYGLSSGDFPDISKFSEKLRDIKFSEFLPLNDTQIKELDKTLKVDIPKLMEELPSERDTPETLKKKMGGAASNPDALNVGLPSSAAKFGKTAAADANPFGYGEEDGDAYWYVVYV